MGNWLKRVKERFLPAPQEGSSLKEDPFGFSVPGRPQFLLRPLFEKLMAKTAIPQDQQEMLESLARKGTVVYALKYRSQLDFVYVNLRLHQLGLPAPTFLFDLRPYFWQKRWYTLKLIAHNFARFLTRDGIPDPYTSGQYEKLVRQGRSGIFFLLGEKGYYQRTVMVQNDPLEHLFDIQKKMDRPIYVVPLILLYSRDPGKQRRGLGEIVFGNPERPGLLRKLVSFIRSYSYAVMEMGEPVNLQEVQTELSEDLWERRKQIFELRRGLIESIDEVRRAIVGPQLKTKLELKEIILHHPKLEAFMRRRAKSSGEPVWKIRKEADEYLEEIAADYSYTLIQMGEKVLTWMWNNLFDGIEVDMASLNRVRKAARHNTLVYVPCHKSHIDYLILSYILFTNNLYSPFIAAGKNLSFWPLGPIFRRGGAFFIRRTFKGARFYAEVFSLYVKTMVQCGHNIEFFIEGGRSRTGKMVLPKLGLLSILIQAVQEGFCDDLVFVPTAICYDRIPEEEVYVHEIKGGAKQDENLGQLVRARRFLKKRYGRVYVQFAEPMSLQRYLERNRYDLEKMSGKLRHAMYRDFAYRIISAINDASLVTPHALVSAALLCRSRRGVSKGELLTTSQSFLRYLEQNNVRFSRTFRLSEQVLDETIRDLVKSKMLERLKDEDDDLEDEVYTLEDSKRLALEYYKNNVIHFLLPAAFVSTSILSQETFRFSLSQILEDMAFMKDLFKYEFVYDMDVRDTQLGKRVLDIFERLGWLRHLEPAEDQPYLLTHRGLTAAHALHGLIRNFFETYWLVLRCMRYVEKKPYTEKDFVKKILAAGEKNLKLELIERPESVSKIVCRNAITYYVEKGLLERRVHETKGRDKTVEKFEFVGDRQLVQFYGRQISRLMRAPHLALQ
ncbi:glycerol-3-phosphate acyltransferase [Desulfacinum hydrothermale DSM 13146]|uniref:Glycerol-3-phosphate acyltransferase n=1 Tax=Desulfacinum hydrothermale DSM 13146 TaxID=1121390 RepID=A0A1W1X9B7_9BACT|nr:1-acyl-sn-glycerol-3-phosphate acyltransferase [Desulfacinum hydrothermale]SMC20572.1 glycerol-3-phosphate acyltransferase [Desulfacinum hydrothermale DSM 13146]